MELQTFIDLPKFLEEIEAELSTDLSGAMSTQTARWAYYGAQHIQAKKQKAMVDLTLKSVEATLVKKYRTNMEAEALAEVEDTNKSPTRVTVDMVKAAVSTDASMLKYSRLLIDAEEIEGICRVAADSFRTRKDMLISLGNLARSEMSSAVRIESAKEAARGYASRRSERDNHARPVPPTQPATAQ